MTFATWNVNSVRRRADQVADWLLDRAPDALCLQETKVDDARFPEGLFDEVGYEVAFHGQKAYNGVAIASRVGVSSVRRGLPGMDDGQARLVSAMVGGVRLASVYVPNGSAPGTPKYAHKLEFFAKLRPHLADLRGEDAPVAVGGDYNVAPQDGDVYDIDDWGRNTILVTDKERRAFGALLDEGFKDAHRACGGADRAHTWWDYRAGAFANDKGLRIDHFLVSGLDCAGVEVDTKARGAEGASDHAPVIMRVRAP